MTMILAVGGKINKAVKKDLIPEDPLPLCPRSAKETL
jgi:hypothetical protein